MPSPSNLLLFLHGQKSIQAHSKDPLDCMRFTQSTPGRGLVLDILNKYTLEEPCPRKASSFIKIKFAYVLQLQIVIYIALLHILVQKTISYVWRWNIFEFWERSPSLSHTMDLPTMFTMIGAMLKTQAVGCEDSLEQGINYSASLYMNSNTPPLGKRLG